MLPFHHPTSSGSHALNNWQLVKAGAAYYVALTDRAQLLTAGKPPIPRTREEARKQERQIIETWKAMAIDKGNTAAAEALQARLDQLEVEAS